MLAGSSHIFFLYASSRCLKCVDQRIPKKDETGLPRKSFPRKRISYFRNAGLKLLDFEEA